MTDDEQTDGMIFGFNGQYRWLSNFWPVSHGIIYAGKRYPTVEHAYQAAKTNVPEEREAILRCYKPGEAKALGKTLTMRHDWDNQKPIIMEGLLRQKFKAGTKLSRQLLNTGEAKIVEANTWGDTYWGRCRGKGKNILGLILMEIRDDLRNNYLTGK